MSRFILIPIALLLTGCGTTPVRTPTPRAAVAPAVSTVPLAATHTRITASTTSAQSHVQIITQTVDRIIERPTTDPAIVAELKGVQSELIRVNADLRDTQEALLVAQAETVKVQKTADFLSTERDSILTERNGINAKLATTQNQLAAAETAKADILHKLHRAKNRVGLVLATVASYLGFVLGSMLPIQYRILLAGIAGIVGYGLGWLIL